MQVQGLGSRQGCVPGVPFGRVITEWVSQEIDQIARDFNIDSKELAKNWMLLKEHLTGPIIQIHPLVHLANQLDMDVDNLRKIKNGKRAWIGFDLADRIVVICTDGLGWLNDPQLRVIYEAFDFSWLDKKKPCVGAAA